MSDNEEHKNQKDIYSQSIVEKILLFLTCRHANPESSSKLRLSVMMCDLIAMITTLSALEFPSSSLLYPVFLVIGHLYSYYFRKANSCLIKIVISVYMIWLLKTFFTNLIASPYSTSQVLVTLLIGLLTAHSFDLPNRRNLSYSLAVSLLLISFSATIFNSTTFIINMLAYFAAFITAMYSHNLSYSYDGTLTVTSNNKSKATSTIKLIPSSLLLALQTIGIFILIFLFTPRFPGLANFKLQTQSNLLQKFYSSNIKSQYEKLTESIKSLKDNLSHQLQNNALNGLERYSDLRSNIPPSEGSNDPIIMQVRTNSQDSVYCRGLVFSSYDGSGWKISKKPLPMEIESSAKILPMPNMFSRRFYETNRKAKEASYKYRYPDPSNVSTHIFYIERDFDSVIYTPYLTTNINYPTENICIDGEGNLSSLDVQEKGTVYTTHSVSPSDLQNLENDTKISQQFLNVQPSEYEITSWQKAKSYSGAPVDRSATEILKQDPNLNKRAVKKYLQLPDSITERTRFLANQITAPYRTPYMKVMALSHFLRSNYSYTRDYAGCPDNMEPNDYFLFVSKEGKCTNFASALAIMCRCSGIMSRYVTGYATNQRSMFTGNYIIRNSNAHAWTEVFLFDDASLWLPVDAVSPNIAISNRKQQKAQFEYTELLNLIQEFLDYMNSNNNGSTNQITTPKSNKNWYITLYYLLKSSILITLELLAFLWIFRNYSLLYLIYQVMKQNSLNKKKRLAIVKKLLQLKEKFCQIIKTDSLSEIEQVFSAVVAILVTLNIEKKPSQTQREFLQNVKETRLKAVLSKIVNRYEEIIYKVSDTNNKHKKYQNLRQAWEALPIESQKVLLILLSMQSLSPKKKNEYLR
ncbi:MAG: transglutaminaseTgpA domain-containing protein [Candidatus Bruticola sp.]